MKKAALLCLTLLVTPVFMAEGSHAALTQSERKYCQRKAENYADERAASFCYPVWQTETLWDVSIDTLRAIIRDRMRAAGE